MKQTIETTPGHENPFRPNCSKTLKIEKAGIYTDFICTRIEGHDGHCAAHNTKDEVVVASNFGGEAE